MPTGGDLNVVHAAQLARVLDRGGPRRGHEQDELDLVEDGAVAIRDGCIVAVGDTATVLAEVGGEDVPTLDVSGMTVVPGLVECHSHPLFVGERHEEYRERLGGASLAEVASRGGGIWASVEKTRDAAEAQLTANALAAYERIIAGGVTTLEVKSGYGLTTEQELRHLRLLEATRDRTPLDLVVTFLGAHIVPRESSDADAFVATIRDEMLPAVVEQGIADFHDVTCESGLFSPAQAGDLLRRSRELGVPTRVHADAWAPSQGWSTAVAGGAVSADHLTYTPDEEIRDTGAVETVAVLLPTAELVYMCETRANARLFMEQEVPVAIATDYCSSIHATSLARTIALAGPWFGITPAAAVVGATLNAAYSLGLGADRGSLEVGRRGDLAIFACAHPNELFLSVGDSAVGAVVADGRVIARAVG